MPRLSLFVVLVATLCLVQSQTTKPAVDVASTTSNSVSSTTNSPTASHSMAISSITPTKSSSMAPKPTVKPTVTPGPNPDESSNYTYVLMDNATENMMNLTCLRMVVDVMVNLTYMNSTNTTNTLWVRFINNSVSTISFDSSVCYGDTMKPNATLALKFASREGVDPFNVDFFFSAIRTPGNQQWLSKGMSVSFTFKETDFPAYKGKKPSEGKHSSSTKESLFDESFQRLELTRPYLCHSENNYTNFSSITTDNSLNISLTVRQLEVQAFNFSNTEGSFDSKGARVCLLDNNNTGNTIVPIAVGAALALLVVIVIIAYLIGRVRNKKKSSYEPLN